MSNYVAFLRGINVGGRTIKMAELKVCFEDMGLKEVKTLLQSGNVLFETNKAEGSIKPMIESNLTKAFNYPAKAQVFSLEILNIILNKYPFGEPSPDIHDYVIFIENGLEESIVAEDFTLSLNENIKSGDGVVYWRVEKGSTLKTSFAKLLTKAKYKDFNTNRNLNTLKKLVNLYSPYK